MPKTSRRTLLDCIGDRFEEMLQTRFPELNNNNTESKTNGSALPDFSTKKFDLESKAGYWNYGVQLKQYQMERFAASTRPIAYAIGFHNLDKSKTLTRGMTCEEIDEFLLANMGMHSAYIVGNTTLTKIWDKEKHAAEQDPNWVYFSLRPQHLVNIIKNRTFKRKGIITNPKKYYGISPAELILRPSPDLRLKNALKFGVILNPEEDEEVTHFLQTHRLLKL